MGFYRVATDTKMTIAAERLAVIAVVTLPITALASVLGMNLIVDDRTTPVPLAVCLALMIAMSSALVLWAKRRGWRSSLDRSAPRNAHQVPRRGQRSRGGDRAG